MTPFSIAKKDLPALRDHLLEMMAHGQGTEAIELVVELLGLLRDKNTELELKVHKLLRKQFGRRSEGVGAEQLELLLGLLGEASDEADADTEQEEAEAEEEPPRKKRRGGGRKKLPENLERREVIIRVPDDTLVAIVGATVTCSLSISQHCD